MSVIQKIRDRGAWIMFGLIALALIAFILQDRALGGGRGSFFSNTTTIGKVNGESIERTDFEAKIDIAQKMYGERAGSRDQLMGNVWSQEVDRIIMEAEYKKLGIVVTGKELSDLLFDPATSPLKREFTDQQTGEFKVSEAKQAFAQLKKSKNQEQLQMVEEAYINPTIQQALSNKYNSLLQKAMYIPKWLVEKQTADNNAITSISYVTVPYTSITDTSKISDEDIMAYAKKHSKEYEREDETRAISYVAFDATASADDTAAVLNQLQLLKADFVNATDAKAFIGKTGSEIPFSDSYFSKTRMQQQQKDSLTKLGIGQTYGPYLDGSSFVIAKMIGVKQWPDSVRVRHILIATNDPRSGQVIKEDSVGKKQIDSIELAIKKGASFDSLVVKYSDDPGSKSKGGVYDYFPQGQMVPSFNDFVFDKPVGTKGVVKTDYGYHYIEILGQKNVQPAYKIAYLAKPIVASNATISTASTSAAQFAATSKDKKQFDENAVKLNKVSLPSGEVKANDFNVTGIGQNRQIVKWMYDHSVGDISEPFEAGDRYIVAILTSVSKPGLPPVQLLRNQIQGIVRNEKKAKQIIDGKFKGATLDAIAASEGVTVSRADSLSFVNPFLPGVGNEVKVAGAAFNKALVGKMSEPIAGATGVFAIQVNTIGASPNATTTPESIKQNLIRGQQMALYRGGDALRKAADIKDYRSKFY
ncbi:PpiC-type peptidyl-prolyl cis-trans isomerase [Russula earlei]|uniref:PpiC-type peptidyl-prolyl cis-trans isomerase n=1 Tax=Russula earlei TaxID=71964 RepID=A0ACC0TSC8_9AGAM|nr:PpiC-type peptidyl-prolyl cis-trans isomerase [Russula earlei]